MLDTGLRCLLLLARFHNIPADAAHILHSLGQSEGKISAAQIVISARSLGMTAARRKIHPKRLGKIAIPAIGEHIDGSFFLIGRSGKSDILIQFADKNSPTLLPLEDFHSIWTGFAILAASKSSIIGELSRFDFSWFIPAIVRYRRLFFEVIAASLVIQIFALITPLMFQVVMDKVLVHRAESTLNVIGLGIVLTALFEITLTGLRSYIFSHTSSRIDVELGGRLFRHLIMLPLKYFSSRRVGDSVARVKELENIRSFLTSNSITLLLDFSFSILFISILFIYSWKLALAVALSIPLYIMCAALATPAIRVRLTEKFNKGAENHSFLVETISAAETVKSMAIEPLLARRWENNLAAYVTASLKAININTITNSFTSGISKLTSAFILWKGASLVTTGELTIGQLIAFNMLANNVSGPILRISTLWSDFQQVGISMQRLGDILNSRPEVVGQRSVIPPISGKITMDNVSFSYDPGRPAILDGISFSTFAGEKIGIVGKSGSGKSTLAKLLQMLYPLSSGRILIDDFDISILEPSSLRRQIGVVLQENILFNQTIRENIAIADPGASLEAVVQAAKLAGAHEFISELPEAYDTVVGEHGVGLSGGQRQRVAIARALMQDPRILVFDEATSALDYESESIIHQNLSEICRNRTVLFISHRLSIMKSMDRILFIEKGKIVEEGTHSELLLASNRQSRYARLYALQEMGA